MILLCRDKNHYSRTVSALFTYYSSTVHAFKNIKNGSYDTIHTFKNYFAIVFSVFSFQFSVSTTISSIQMDLQSMMFTSTIFLGTKSQLVPKAHKCHLRPQPIENTHMDLIRMVSNQHLKFSMWLTKQTFGSNLRWAHRFNSTV